MKVSRILVTSFLFVATAFTATNAHAQGAVRLSWDGCDPYVQNKQFTGPGQIAKAVMSLSQESRTIRGYRLQVAIGGPSGLGDAWRFDAGQCNGGQTALSVAAIGKTCPAVPGANPIAFANYSYDGVIGKALVDFQNAFTSTDLPLAPATRYMMFDYNFNHAFSNVGPRDPALECGFAELPLCLHLVYTEHLFPDLTSGTYNLETDFITWQDPNNGSGCPGATQNTESTWGRVKGLYR